MWDLDKDDNYVLALDKSLGYVVGESINCVAYCAKKGKVVYICTCMLWLMPLKCKIKRNCEILVWYAVVLKILRTPWKITFFFRFFICKSCYVGTSCVSFVYLLLCTNPHMSTIIDIWPKVHFCKCFSSTLNIFSCVQVTKKLDGHLFITSNGKNRPPKQRNYYRK